IGNNLNDLRDFVAAQPPTTVVGVAYMANATVRIIQDLTADHGLAAKAIRLPRGTLSAMDSPYLSLISLAKGWPEQNVRRQVLMVSDGIDRLRGQSPTAGQLGPSFEPAFHSLPTISPDADRASTTSQRHRVIVQSIYSPGVGRESRNSWHAQLGQSGLTKVSEETGGEHSSLSFQTPVSFKPSLERIQGILNNQYFVVFQAEPPRRAGLERVKVTTTIEDAEILAPDN